MKHFLLCVLAVGFVTGCATQKQVATMQGQGKKETFAASYDQVWRAAIDAAQNRGLEVSSTDRATGYIAARRGVRLHTFGENVGIWVHPVSPNQTEVEVASRQAGPPALWLKNWERDILNSVRANLTREASNPTISEPAGVNIQQQDPTYLPGDRR